MTSIPRGGLRPGAGRPRGTGAFGEPTTPVRIPESRLAEVRTLIARPRRPAAPELEWTGEPDASAPGLSLPLFASRIQAGFPSPADDYVEGKLDLNQHLIRNPPATFFLRVQGESMLGAGIHPGDLLVVDRSIEPKHGAVVIAVVDGELTVKRLWLATPERVELRAENPAYAPIVIGEFQQFELWGVVTSVIHPLLP
ncbi:LexA family protein [Methylococcus mesophilus]|uniref:LexA family protein n=1 Tax=Methylococcus mesophilus TaxID=2993564 RepID=UPI002939341B|nr:translesion error-prone DNA polymerase V autoproteolytic subunit [Methylococcus mesophilus]